MTATASLPDQTNRHFLKALTDLSEQHDIETAEDVFAHNGMKLVARGTRVTPSMYEHVVQHKLASPIEKSVVMLTAPGPEDYKRMGERLLDEVPLVHTMCAWSNGRVTPLGMLRNLNFNPATRTVLAVAQQRKADALRHDVMVSMLAMGLSNAYRYTDQKLLADVAIGGLFHDVGEAYMDPILHQTGRRWSSREWLSYSAHPIISAALAREIGGLDGNVQRAVLEHHEQCDGHGYPRYLNDQGISIGGKLLSLANALADLADLSTPNRRISIALKIMPEEFSPEIVSVVLAIIGLAEHFSEVALEQTQDVDAAIHVVFMRIAHVMQVYEESQAEVASLSLPARQVVERVVQRFSRIQQAFASTGVGGLQEIRAYLNREELCEMRFEASCVFDEIDSRLQRLSRELALKASHFEPTEQAVLHRLADAMLHVPALATAGLA